MEEKGRSKAREEDRKALESIGSMVNPSPCLGFPSLSATGPFENERTTAATAVAIFHRSSRGKGHAWPLAVRSGTRARVCVCGKRLRCPVCIRLVGHGEGGIKLPFVNIERDLTTPSRLLLLHRIKMDAAKTRFSRRETLIMGNWGAKMARWCALVKGIRRLRKEFCFYICTCLVKFILSTYSKEFILRYF